ncbi:MAG: hypothetical protein ACXVCS_14140 [Bdellovibrionota bacterium]
MKTFALFFLLLPLLARADETYEQGRVQRRLELVETLLRRQDPPQSAPLRQARARNLDRLKEYWRRGSFPKNTLHPGLRVPTFIDDQDVPCAVGYLLLQDGHEALAEKVRKESNDIYIDQIHDPEFLDWAAGSGLSLTELELIQPAYGGMDAPVLKSLASRDYAAVKKAFVNGKPPAIFLPSAIACGDIAGAEWLLKNGADPTQASDGLLECNGQGGMGKSYPLAEAIRAFARSAYFRIELHWGKIVLKPWPGIEEPSPPLTRQQRRAYRKLVEHLLAPIIDLTPMRGVLLDAVATGDAALVKILLTKKWDLGATGTQTNTDDNSDTLYFWTGKPPSEDACRFRNPIASSLAGGTALDLALWNGDDKIVKLLKAAGAKEKLKSGAIAAEIVGNIPDCSATQKKLARNAQRVE